MHQMAQVQMLYDTDDLQNQVTALTKLLATALKDKGKINTTDRGKELANLEFNLNKAIKATNTSNEASQEQ